MESITRVEEDDDTRLRKSRSGNLAHGSSNFLRGNRPGLKGNTTGSSALHESGWRLVVGGDRGGTNVELDETYPTTPNLII